METLKIIIEYTLIITSVFLLIRYINFNLKYYQQSHYQISSFINYFKSYYLKKKSLYLVPFIPLILFMNLWYVQLVSIIYVVYLYIISFKEKEIKRLVYTNRIIRQYLLIIIIYTVIATLMFLSLNLKELCSALFLLLIFNPLLIYVSSLFIYPLEKLISKYYQKKAYKLYIKYNPKVIAITGSYGKTSTKDIIYQVLSKVKRVLKTPNSFNTINGISMTINNNLSMSDEYLILEMGASKKGDIKELTSFIKPSYSIVTAIGYSHLETFKTIENIINEKMKVIECLNADEVAFINIDNEFIRNYQISSKCKIITYGYQDSDYQIIDPIVCFNHIECKIKHQNKYTEIKSNLLGRHNLYNLCAAFALLSQLGVDENIITDTFLSLNVTPHRLELKKIENHYILDDAFNSNFEGFKNALEVLSMYDKKKIVITPGIVETGSKETKINQEISKIIAKSCDVAYIIKSKTGNIIYEELKKIKDNNIYLCSSFKEAYSFINEECCVLIENDLSDFYLI